MRHAAIFLPRKTRDGVALEPMEPAWRITSCEPWVMLSTPCMPCRLMTPAVPRPLVRPLTSTLSPAANFSTVIASPTL